MVVEIARLSGCNMLITNGPIGTGVNQKDVKTTNRVFSPAGGARVRGTGVAHGRSNRMRYATVTEAFTHVAINASEDEQ